MRSKIFGCLITIFVSIPLLSQHKINNYKYIIIPKQFDFLKKPDQHQTSSLIKFLFNKHGFVAFLNDDELPEELATNRCLGLNVNLKNDSGFFTTKNIIVLRDCFGKVIYTTMEGVSRQKNYKKAYHEAIRKAFKSIEDLNYRYVVSIDKTSSKTEKSNESKITIKKSALENKKNRITQVDVLYAQPKEYGFQLVNTIPEVVFQVIKTDKENVYILKDKNGILYKNDNKWFVEYYLDGKKVIQQYQIKF